jgi:hypothetical protein
MTGSWSSFGANGVRPVTLRRPRKRTGDRGGGARRFRGTGAGPVVPRHGRSGGDTAVGATFGKVRTRWSPAGNPLAWCPPPALHPRSALGRPVEGVPARGEGTKPQGREWLKHVTGSGEDQAVKVAENDEDGTTRMWNSAARRACRRANGQPDVQSVRRDMDSPSLERRRGKEPQGRRAESSPRWSCIVEGTEPEAEEEVLEGGCKARSGVAPDGSNRLVALRRKTPGSRSQGRKGEGGAAKPSEQLRRDVKR